MLYDNIDVRREKDTKKVAEKLYDISRKGDVLGLSGEMGTGKTTFAKYFIQKGSKNQNVPSPTYNLYFKYNTKKATVYHLDAWRLEESMELVNLGIEEFLQESILLVEWPENIKDLLPKKMLIMKFSIEKKKRNLLLSGNEVWKKRIKCKLNG